MRHASCVNVFQARRFITVHSTAIWRVKLCRVHRLRRRPTSVQWLLVNAVQSVVPAVLVVVDSDWPSQTARQLTAFSRCRPLGQRSSITSSLGSKTATVMTDTTPLVGVRLKICSLYRTVGRMSEWLCPRRVQPILHSVNTPLLLKVSSLFITVLFKVFSLSKLRANSANTTLLFRARQVLIYEYTP